MQLAYPYFEMVQYADYYFGNRKPQTAAHREHLVASKVTIWGIISPLPFASNSEFYCVWDLAELSNPLKEVSVGSAWHADIDHTLMHHGEWFLPGRNDRAMSRFPICRALGRINRVRDMVSLWHEKIVVLNAFGRRTAGGTFLQSSFLA